MANYKEDRSFTDFVHHNLALPVIYEHLNWKPKTIDADLQQQIDIQNGIDYVFENEKGEKLNIQERFRDESYKLYKDCTLRYKREQNSHIERHLSEFFKIKADYLVYGITNGSKWPEKRNTLTNFLKFAVIDLRILFDKIDNGSILLRKGRKESYIQNSKMIAPINDNSDGSSSFVAFDIYQLHKLFGSENIIVFQKGF